MPAARTASTARNMPQGEEGRVPLAVEANVAMRAGEGCTAAEGMLRVQRLSLAEPRRRCLHPRRVGVCQPFATLCCRRRTPMREGHNAIVPAGNPTGRNAQNPRVKARGQRENIRGVCFMALPRVPLQKRRRRYGTYGGRSCWVWRWQARHGGGAVFNVTNPPQVQGQAGGRRAETAACGAKAVNSKQAAGRTVGAPAYALYHSAGQQTQNRSA